MDPDPNSLLFLNNKDIQHPKVLDFQLKMACVCYNFKKIFKNKPNNFFKASSWSDHLEVFRETLGYAAEFSASCNTVVLLA